MTPKCIGTWTLSQQAPLPLVDAHSLQTDGDVSVSGIRGEAEALCSNGVGLHAVRSSKLFKIENGSRQENVSLTPLPPVDSNFTLLLRITMTNGLTSLLRLHEVQLILSFIHQVFVEYLLWVKLWEKSRKWNKLPLPIFNNVLGECTYESSVACCD